MTQYYPPFKILSLELIFYSIIYHHRIVCFDLPFFIRIITQLTLSRYYVHPAIDLEKCILEFVTSEWKRPLLLFFCLMMDENDTIQHCV